MIRFALECAHLDRRSSGPGRQPSLADGHGETAHRASR